MHLCVFFHAADHNHIVLAVEEGLYLVETPEASKSVMVFESKPGRMHLVRYVQWS